MNLLRVAWALALVPAVALFFGPCAFAQETGIVVRIGKTEQGYQLFRNGQPYFIKGAVVGPGGSWEALAAAGANSVRTQRRGFSALVGLPLGNPRQGFNYADTNQVEGQYNGVRDLVRQYRHHPALLLWNLGNEPEIRTTPAERVPLWREVNRLAEMVKQEDPDHPVMAVIGGQYADMLHELNDYCPALDLAGLNSYAQMLRLPEEVARQGWTRPYVVTEFGPRGHWQASKTPWGVPIEDDGNAKADFYLKAYQHSVAGQANCLGSYVFHWAHKQEKTHTWYGMFLSDGSRTPAVDAMTFLWTGHWPTNRCPTLEGNKLSVTLADGSSPALPGVFNPGVELACAVQVSDPDGDSLQVSWELRPDVADHPGIGGDWEPSVELLPGAVLSTNEEGRRAIVQVPSKPGKYRLFVYARDGHGNATTANLPLRAQYPAISAWQPDPGQREHLLRRSLTLLCSSTPTNRNTVRILFYGQSITQQAWWREVERYLRATYTNANLVIENHAIGGHAAQLLVKTAEADLYPFEPDLLIFHVYGSHTEYENIIRRVRERTCADILLQTDHITKEEWSLHITEASPDGKLCRFALRGSVTGEDGSGVSTNRFVSNSGRVVIGPEDWNLNYCVKVFNRPLPENHTATWRAVLRGADKAEAPDLPPGTERSLTVAHGLSPGRHVLELSGPHIANQIRSARFYCPPRR